MGKSKEVIPKKILEQMWLLEDKWVAFTKDILISADTMEELVTLMDDPSKYIIHYVGKKDVNYFFSEWSLI